MPMFLTFEEIRAEFDHVDDPDVLERMKRSRGLEAALEMTRPRNWWGVGVPAQRLIDISLLDGIPLVWVPRMEMVRQLAELPDRDSRIGYLMAATDQVLDDVGALLAECTDEWVHDLAYLARCAVQAFVAGHHEAAMALAASVGEPVARWASTPRVMAFDSEAAQERWRRERPKSLYKWAENELSQGAGMASPASVVRTAVIAPIPSFFADWFPQRQMPLPNSLSRHVVAHAAAAEHFSRENTLIALMLVTSLLREQQDWAEEVRVMDQAE